MTLINKKVAQNKICMKQNKDLKNLDRIKAVKTCYNTKMKRIKEEK